MLVKATLGALLALSPSCGTMAREARMETLFDIRYGGKVEPVSDSWLEYGGARLRLSTGGTFLDVPRFESPFMLEWRDPREVLHRARIEFSDDVFRTPPPNGRSWSLKLIIDSSNQIEMAYQSRDHYDPSSYEVWQDLAHEMTMLPVEDPRDKPVVRQHEEPNKEARARFKSKRDGDVYVGPGGLFHVQVNSLFGRNVSIREMAHKEVGRDRPGVLRRDSEASSVTIASLTDGRTVSIGFRRYEKNASAPKVIESIKQREIERLEAAARVIKNKSENPLPGLEPEMLGVGEAASYFGYVFPNQEFKKYFFPYYYEYTWGDLKTIGVSRFYVVKDHLIQVAAILPLPREGMTAEEAKEYGLSEMERIMEAITFPESEG